MEKINTYIINKIFTVPYIDKLVDAMIDRIEEKRTALGI